MTPEEAACLYAGRMGWAVFPINPRTKMPFAGSHGHLDATCDIQTIMEMWSRQPSAGVAVACGDDSDLLVVDVDEKNGKSGSKTLVDEDLPLRPTLIADTRSGGTHHFYLGAQLARSRTDLLEGVDVKANGGYVAVWPTFGYKFRLEPNQRLNLDLLVEPPGWAIQRRQAHAAGAYTSFLYSDSAIEMAVQSLHTVAHDVAFAAEGTRNDVLNKAAFGVGLLVRIGYVSKEEAIKVLTNAGRAAGLRETEIGRTVRSGLRGAEEAA